jgi:hypothetical protein
MSHQTLRNPLRDKSLLKRFNKHGVLKREKKKNSKHTKGVSQKPTRPLANQRSEVTAIWIQLQQEKKKKKTERERMIHPNTDREI